MLWLLKRKGTSSWFAACEPTEDSTAILNLAAKLGVEGYDVRIVRILKENKAS